MLARRRLAGVGFLDLAVAEIDDELHGTLRMTIESPWSYCQGIHDSAHNYKRSLYEYRVSKTIHRKPGASRHGGI
jgi:hypothetical protein